MNALAAAGYATRRRAGDGDRRVRTVGITDAGASHVAQANDALVERLYALFPTEDAAHRTIDVYKRQDVAVAELERWYKEQGE